MRACGVKNRKFYTQKSPNLILTLSDLKIKNPIRSFYAEDGDELGFFLQANIIFVIVSLFFSSRSWVG